MSAPETSRMQDGMFPDTVDELRTTVGQLLTSEAQRAQGLDTRSTWLAGFCGVVLALTADLAPQLLAGQIRGGARAVVLVAHILIVVLLVTAASASLSALLPRNTTVIAMREVNRYPTTELVAQPRYLVQGRTLRGLVESLRADRVVNDRKARRFRLAVLALGVGLLFVGLETTMAALFMEQR